MAPLSVLISGAGIAGPALAYWLRTHGFAPTLIERAPQLRTGGYIIDFWGVGYEIADRMGLLPTLRARGYHIDTIRYVRADGRTRSDIDAESIDRATSGRFLSLPRGELARSIYELVAGDIETIFDDRVVAYREDDHGVEVDLEHGGTRRFDLLVGCDGVHSEIRGMMFGDSRQHETYLGYVAASFITNGYPERDETAYVSFAAPGRQISRYALRDDRTAFFFVCARDDRPDAEPHDLDAHKRLLLDTFAGDDWRELPAIRERLESADDLYFDTVTQAHVPAWSRGRVALLGDAAFCPSLLAGAGSSYAMAGAYILAGELHAAGGDHRAAFAGYERAFRPFIERKQKAARNFASSFAPRTSAGIFFRDQVLKLMHVPVLGPWLIKRTVSDNLALPAYS
ncbi:MAG: FAD-binding domain [Kofleriaceae bacterium]